MSLDDAKQTILCDSMTMAARSSYQQQHCKHGGRHHNTQVTSGTPAAFTVDTVEFFTSIELTPATLLPSATAFTAISMSTISSLPASCRLALSSESLNPCKEKVQAGVGRRYGLVEKSKAARPPVTRGAVT